MKDNWTTKKHPLLKKSDPSAWLKWRPSENKNWYHLRINNCKVGYLIQPEQVGFIVNRIIKRMRMVEDEE